jgi:DNA polymerase III delta prime subunit
MGDTPVYLSRIVEKECVPHLLLFSGKNQTKKEVAFQFARRLLEKLSPGKPFDRDIHLVSTCGKTGMHSIEAFREMSDKVALAPFHAAGKVVIIEDADRTSAQVANTLLKTIEEPPARTWFILLADTREKLLPTIYSRCQEVRFRPDQEEVSPKYGSFFEPLLTEPLTFVEVVEVAANLAGAAEEHRKELEETLLASSDQEKEMNAVARQKAEDLREGALTLRWLEEVDVLLFELIAFLREKKGVDAIEVDPALSFARLALARSMPTSNVIESFLLRLLPL